MFKHFLLDAAFIYVLLVTHQVLQLEWFDIVCQAVQLA
jgi:hypothetical protein